MATNSIPDQQISDNIPPNLTAAIEAAGTLAGQVGQHRLDAGIALATAGQVSRNPAGGFDVTSRTTGTPYHINGASCTCKDAEYGAPWVLGRKACAHQVAVWIVIKAARLAAQGAEVAAPAAIQPGTQPASEPASELVELPLADLIAAAANANGTEYELVPSYMGGHGQVNILHAIDHPDRHQPYLLDGDWREDRLHVCKWGWEFGLPDPDATRKLAEHRPAVTPSLTVEAGDPRGLKPAVAYYLETSSWGVKVMCSRGERNPRPIQTFSGPDRLEDARVLARTRAEATYVALRHATPAGRYAVANALLPESWRQRMGGSQIGKAWVVYAQAVEQPQEMAA